MEPNHGDDITPPDEEPAGERRTFHDLQGLLKGKTNGRTLTIDEINEGIVDGCLAANHPNVPRTTRINTLAPIPIKSSGKS